MLFENLKLELDELPRLEEGSFEKLERDYLYLRLTTRSLFFLMLAGLCTIFTFTASWSLVQWLPALLVVYAAVFTIEVLGFKIKGYAIRQLDVSYRTGLIFYSMTSVPLNRVQHCEYAQGPLDRLFDLATVKVYTAGGASSDLSIHGLTKERAIRLRDYITKLSAQYE